MRALVVFPAGRVCGPGPAPHRLPAPRVSPAAAATFLLCARGAAGGGGAAMLRWNGSTFSRLTDPLSLLPADAAGGDEEDDAELPQTVLDPDKPQPTVVIVDHELSPTQLRNLERVGHAGAKQVAFVVQKNLGFIDQATKGGGVHDAVAVTLKSVAGGGVRLGVKPTPAQRRITGQVAECGGHGFAP
jgi:hypothetical protein